MKKRIHKLLSLMLTLILVVGMIPMTSLPAFAATASVGKINAVGTGYEYSSTLGAYTPVFSTMEAYDTGGNKINISNFVNNSNYSFYTSSSFTSANKLTTEPQDGETYYFGIYVNQYVDDVSYDYDRDSIRNNSTVSLPGFEVEYDGLMECEMGSYLQIVYKATKIIKKSIYVGNVKMTDGIYLAQDTNSTTTSKPSGGYAHYADGVLTLHDYTVEGNYQYKEFTNEYGQTGRWYASIYSKDPITIQLEGENFINSAGTDVSALYEKRNFEGIYCEDNVIVRGTGSLNMLSDFYSMHVDGDIIIDSGTVNIKARDHEGVDSCNALFGLIINGGNVSIDSDHEAVYSPNINGGNVYICSGVKAVGGTLNIAEGLCVQASTTRDGALGEYDPAMLADYKQIKVTIDAPPTITAPVIKSSNVAKTGKIKLTWDDIDNAMEYKVYRATSKTGKYYLMKTTEGTTYTNTSAKAGSTYYYYVIAVAADGTKSEKSNIVTRTCDCARPAVTASNVASSGKIKLTWKEVDGAVEYKVYRATSEAGEYKLMKTTEGTSYTNTGATAGKLYYYKVKAIGTKSAATSAYSLVDSRRCDLPRPVVKITTSSGKPKVSWAAITGAKEYKIYRATSKSGSYKLVKTTENEYWKDTSAVKGKTYYYKVKAIHDNSAANSAYSLIKYIKCTK